MKKQIPKQNKVKAVDSQKMEILKAGMQTDFWKIVTEAIEESIDFLKEQMDAEDLKDLPPEQYKFINETLKARVKYLETLINTPQNLISWLEKPDNERKDFDPYEK